MTNLSDRFRQAGGSFIKGAFAIAVALLLVLVLRSVAVQISPPPNPIMEAYPNVSTPIDCENAGGRWVTAPIVAPGEKTQPQVEDGRFQSYCQGPLRFERERLAQSEASQQTSLFVFALGGAIAIALSLLVSLLQPVSPGLILGAIVSFFIATVHVWTLAPGIGRLITIIVIIVVVLGIGAYVFRDQKVTNPSL